MHPLLKHFSGNAICFVFSFIIYYISSDQLDTAPRGREQLRRGTLDVSGLFFFYFCALDANFQAVHMWAMKRQVQNAVLLCKISFIIVQRATQTAGIQAKALHASLAYSLTMQTNDLL